MNHLIKNLCILYFLITCSANLQAQANFYKVYQYETPLMGHIEFALWNTYIPKSNLSKPFFGKNLSRQGLFAHSIEAEIGITDHFAIGGYADFEDPQNGNFKFTQTHLVARYRFFQRYDKWVNPALYVEYYFPVSDYSNSQELEARLILDKDFNDLRVAINPMVSVYTTGDENKSLQPAINAGIYYRRTKVQPGVEFYSNFKEKTATLFPTIDLYPSPNISWNIGVGFGLTPQSDAITIKSIIQWDVQAIRPSRLFRRPIVTQAGLKTASR
jgi:hypothetical protein